MVTRWSDPDLMAALDTLDFLFDLDVDATLSSAHDVDEDGAP